MSNWPRVELGQLLTKSADWIDISPEACYREVTVRLWGKGVVARGEVSGSDIAASSRLRVRSGQFILSRIDARNGALGVVPPALDGAVVSSDFPAYTLNTERLLPEFLGWLCRTAGFVDQCRAASEGTTNRVRLKEHRFLACMIPLPPLAEQRRIVAKIDALAAKMGELHELWTAVEYDERRLLLASYHQIAESGRRLPMAEVAPLVRRPVKISMDQVYPELGIRSFGKGTFHKPGLAAADLGTKRLFRIEPGDLLFNIVFAWEGAVAVARAQDSGRFGSHRFLTCVPKPELALPGFLCFHFLTEGGLADLLAASPGGAGRNRTLGIKALESIQVPVPCIDKQRWFHSLQTKVQEMRALRAKAGEELEALLPSLLDRAFAGEL